jgi:hypothetical protein
VLESIAQIDGSVVFDPDSRLLAFGAILRHWRQVDEDEEIGEGDVPRRSSAPRNLEVY